MPRCLNCKEKFVARKFLQKYCTEHEECIAEFVKSRKGKFEAENKKKERKQNKEQKESLMSHSDYLKILQTKINIIIRNIDTNSHCISSNRSVGQFHSGHFYTVGGKPSLRFNLFNIWKQSAQDNKFKSGNIQEYITNLNRLFGYECVHENIMNLPYKYPVLKLSNPEIIEKIDICKEIIKEQKSGNYIALSTEDRINIRNVLQKRLGIYK